MPVERIAIGIPTFKRPNGLRKLLISLAGLSTHREVEIFVAENDVENRAGEAVCHDLTANGYRFPITVLPVDERGISQARNALLQAVLPASRFSHMGMLDDDEWVTNTWLDEMLSAHTKLGVDVVGGPVKRVFTETTIPTYLRAALNAKQKAKNTQRIKSLESTANIMFDLAMMRQWDGNWFDPAFSLTGGGDRDFLLRLRLFGETTFGWASQALIFEDFPASRCTVEWALKRAYRVGNSEMIAYLKNKPPRYAIKEGIKVAMAGTYFLVAHSVLAFSEEDRFKGRQALSRALGTVDALRGKTYVEYNVVHGS